MKLKQIYNDKYFTRSFVGMCPKCGYGSNDVTFEKDGVKSRFRCVCRGCGFKSKFWCRSRKQALTKWNVEWRRGWQKSTYRLMMENRQIWENQFNGEDY